METFTDKVKHELIRLKEDRTQLKMVELAALIRMDGSIQITNRQLAVKIKIYHGDLARKVYSLIKKEYNFNIEIIVSRLNNFSRHHVYELILLPQKGIKEFLIKLGFLDENNDIIFQIKPEFLSNVEYRKAYLRGAFLGGGSINNPRSEYHLELRCDHESEAEDLLLLLNYFDLEAHKTEHKQRYVVYFKSYDDITTFLNIIGAHNSLLQMENIHILKEVKNNVNRKVNGETANLDKTIEAAMEQLENIQLIDHQRGLNSLAASLQEIAQLRRENPYASLKELGQLLEPSLSKSGVNHRIRRLNKIARKLRGE